MTASFVVTSWLVRCNFALCGLAVVPAGNSAKIAIVDWVAKQKWAGYLSYALHAMVIFETLFFVLSAVDLWQAPTAAESATLAGVGSANALLQAQRDTYLAATAIFSLLMLRSYFILLHSNHRLQLSHSALQRQAEGASKVASDLLGAAAKPAKKAPADAPAPATSDSATTPTSASASAATVGTSPSKPGATGGAAGGAAAGSSGATTGGTSAAGSASTEPGAVEGSGGAGDASKLRAEVDALQAKLTSANANAEASMKQAQGTSAAFAQLMEENRSLKEQLRDFDLLLSSRKKGQ